MTVARVRALAVLGVLLVAAAVVVVWALMKDGRTPNTVVQSCPSGYPTISTDVPPPQDIKVHVYNGTDIANLAASGATALRARKFNVVGKPAGDPLHHRAKGVVELRYGPRTIGAAQLLEAYFLGGDGVKSVYSAKNHNDTVDVVLGPQYKQLGTPSEVAQMIGVLGKPSAPAGTCIQQ